MIWYEIATKENGFLKVRCFLQSFLHRTHLFTFRKRLTLFLPSLESWIHHHAACFNNVCTLCLFSMSDITIKAGLIHPFLKLVIKRKKFEKLFFHLLRRQISSNKQQSVPLVWRNIKECVLQSCVGTRTFFLEDEKRYLKAFIANICVDSYIVFINYF